LRSARNDQRHKQAKAKNGENSFMTHTIPPDENAALVSAGMLRVYHCGIVDSETSFKESKTAASMIF